MKRKIMVSVFVLFMGVEAPAAPAANAVQETAVQMSAFEVGGDKDVGYQGGNTTSGSRLNTSLKDTAASILVVTKEFMSDFGLNSLEEITASLTVE